MRSLVLVVLLAEVFAAWAPGRDARTRRHDPVTTTVTFERDVRGILRARCGSCHAAGGPAPMPLTTYDEVRPWARAIKSQVLTRRMPMWHAAHGYGAFANDPSLTAAEIVAVASWVDGGQPRGTASGRPVTRPAVSLTPSTALSIPRGAVETSVRVPARYIAGWSFEPGDPLITSAAFTSADGSPLATWVAGDEVVRLPADAAMRVTSPIRVHVQRRKAADYEKPAVARASVLRLATRASAPPRRVWTEQVECGAARAGRGASLLAVRPLLADGAAARVWLERPGAARVIVGWFRDYEQLYPRAFWLARPADLLPESRVQADTACTIELTLLGR